MAWEQRGNEAYYYTTHRSRGRRKRQYLGGKTGAMASAMIDELIQIERRRMQRRYEELRQAHRELHWAAQQFEELSELFLGAGLIAAGLGRQGRYLWNHRPYLRCIDPIEGDVVLMEQLRDVVRRAQRYGARVAPEVRAFLDGHPGATEEVYGLGRRVRRLCLDLAAGEDEELRRRLDDAAILMARQLAEGADEFLVQLQSERAALAWMQQVGYDSAAQQVEKLTKYPASFLMRERDDAQGRKTKALRTLAEVRRLLAGPPSAPRDEDAWEADWRAAGGARPPASSDERD